MDRLKNILIIAVLLLLNAPWLSEILGFKEPHPLHGESVNPASPVISLYRVWCGEFQSEVNDFSRSNFLLRSVAIRTRNELDYSFFREHHARSVVEGLDGYLFEENYILAALGLDSIPKDSVGNRVSRLLQLSQASKTPFLVVIAPGKGNFCREFVPREYLKREGQLANRMLNMWTDELVNQELPFLNLTDFFSLDQQVFPKHGIHWSEWAQVEAINQISNALSELLPDGLRPARLLIDSVYRSTSMKGTDDDIEKGLNLWRNLPDVEAKYYLTHWEELPVVRRPRILIVGDSYAWGPVNKGLLRDGYRDSEFWFYNKGVHGPLIDDKGASPETVHGFSNLSELEQVLLDFDAVVFLSTDANLPTFPFHFGEFVN